METELVFFLNGNVDAEEAAYAGYKAIEDMMETDAYIDPVVATVIRLEYLSPLPLSPPPQLNEDPSTNAPQIILASSQTRDVSPWTIGATVATIMGGLVSIVVWSRNRRARNRGHIHMMDDFDSHPEDQGYSI
jgi:hypothetical protein